MPRSKVTVPDADLDDVQVSFVTGHGSMLEPVSGCTGVADTGSTTTASQLATMADAKRVILPAPRVTKNQTFLATGKKVGKKSTHASMAYSLIRNPPHPPYLAQRGEGWRVCWFDCDWRLESTMTA